MPFYFNRFSGVLLIFFVHGLVYAIMAWNKSKEEDNSRNKWLSFFLLLCILYICPWMLGFAGWYDGMTCLECRNFLFYMPLQQTLLLGPVIYFYVQAVLNPGFRLMKKDRWHWLPGIAFNVWSLVVAVTDRVILKKYYLMDGQNDPDFARWYVAAGLCSILYYLWLSFRYYRKYRQFILEELSFADVVSYKWIRNFLVACMVYFFSSLLLNILFELGLDIKYTESWWYYFLFALLFYYIAINGYSHAIEHRVFYELDFLKYESPIALPVSLPEQPTIESNSVQLQQVLAEAAPTNAPPAEAWADWKEKVLAEVVHTKAYTNPELTLTVLAQKMDTNASFLSKVINQGFGMNFNDFINYYRVQQVKQALERKEHATVTIMSLAYDAGFNSKATFNRAFKKVTQQNPSDFTLS